MIPNDTTFSRQKSQPIWSITIHSKCHNLQKWRCKTPSIRHLTSVIPSHAPNLFRYQALTLFLTLKGWGIGVPHLAGLAKHTNTSHPLPS